MDGWNPFGGTRGNDGDPAGPAQGRAVLAGPVQLGPLPCAGAPSISWANIHPRGVVQLSATVRLHALVGKKDGHTFAPNGRNETRHWMPGPVRIGSDSLTTVFKCLCDYMLIVSLCVGSLQFH